MCYPLTIFSMGVIASLITFSIATNIATPWSYRHLDRSFGLQQLISTVLLYPLIMGMAYGVLPSKVTLVDPSGVDKVGIPRAFTVNNLSILLCRTFELIRDLPPIATCFPSLQHH